MVFDRKQKQKRCPGTLTCSRGRRLLNFRFRPVFYESMVVLRLRCRRRRLCHRRTTDQFSKQVKRFIPMSFCIYRSICSLNEAGYSNELFYFVFCCVILGPMRTSQRRRRHRPNMPVLFPDGNAEGSRHKDKGDDSAGNCNGVPEHLVDGNSRARVQVVVRPRPADMQERMPNGVTMAFPPLPTRRRG